MPQLELTPSSQEIHHSAQDTGDVRGWTGMLQTPSVSHPQIRKISAEQSNHDLRVAFGLASARWRPILLLTGNTLHPKVCLTAWTAGIQLGGKWVRPCSLGTKSSSRFLRQIFSKIHVTDHLHFNTKGNFNITLCNYVHKSENSEQSNLW